jgi:hypothetical protein
LQRSHRDGCNFGHEFFFLLGCATAQNLHVNDWHVCFQKEKLKILSMKNQSIALQLMTGLSKLPQVAST